MKYILAVISLFFVGCTPICSVRVSSIISPNYSEIKEGYVYILTTSNSEGLSLKDKLVLSDIGNCVNFKNYSPAAGGEKNNRKRFIGMSVSYKENVKSESSHSYAYPVFTSNKAKTSYQYNKNGQITSYSHTPSSIQYAETVNGNYVETDYLNEVILRGYKFTDDFSDNLEVVWEMSMVVKSGFENDLRDFIPAMMTAASRNIGIDTRGYVTENINYYDKDYKRIKAKSHPAQPVQKEASSSN